MVLTSYKISTKPLNRGNPSANSPCVEAQTASPGTRTQSPSQMRELPGLLPVKHSKGPEVSQTPAFFCGQTWIIFPLPIPPSFLRLVEPRGSVSHRWPGPGSGPRDGGPDADSEPGLLVKGHWLHDHQERGVGRESTKRTQCDVAHPHPNSIYTKHLKFLFLFGNSALLISWHWVCSSGFGEAEAWGGGTRNLSTGLSTKQFSSPRRLWVSHGALCALSLDCPN